jgi:hypothetical protein
MNKVNKYILVLVYFVATQNIIFAQILESRWATIKINNKPASHSNINDTIAPVISMISPQVRINESFITNSQKLTIIGKVTDNISIKSLLINSKEIIPNSSGIFSNELMLKEGANNISIIASDLNMNIAENKIIVEYIPEDQSTEAIEVKGNYYALLIAVSEYKNPDLFNLDNPIKDAEALRNVITTRYTFKEDNITFLKNPGMEDILGAFDQISRRLTKDDNLLIFYAGHGWWDKDAGIGFWLPSDADKVNRTHWIRNSTVQDFMKEIKVKHALLVTDACFSGSIFVARSINFNTSLAIKKLYEMPSRKAMTSGSLTEVPDQSIFVKYFIDRLIHNEEKTLSAEQLFSSFRIAVINNSDVLPQYGVIKNVGDEGGEFIFIHK